MKKKTIILSLIISALMTVNAFASFSIEGALKSTRADESVNINPWNAASFKGVGEGNEFTFYMPDGKVEIPLDYPLYRLSAGYTDKLTCKDGIWGIERNVGIKTFDGSENWSLIKKTAFLNDSSTVFTCDFGENAPDVLSGWCTHFDVYKFSGIKSSTYDGISFGENSDSIIMRIMNVRNIKTVDALKTYLKKQYDSGSPVKLFYCLNEPVFTPFDDLLQKELNSISPSKARFTDSNCLGIRNDSVCRENTSLFTAWTSANAGMDNFLSAVSSVKIFNCDKDKKFYVSGITKDKNGLTFAIKDENNDVYTSYLPYSAANFITERTTELIFKGKSKEIIKFEVYLNRIHVPETCSGFTYATTGIRPECIMQKSAVIPTEITALTGTELDFTNALLNSSVNYGDDIELFYNDKQVTAGGKLKVTEKGQKTYTVCLNGEKIGYTTVYAYNNNKKLDGKTVMFLGDSLINQNLYSQYFSKLAGDVNLIGTLGTDGNRHEGRGGWSAYDYCNVSTKYGFTNPFLNNGKFDFSYYMKKNGFKSPDYIVVDLGINDLNLQGHNSHSEILLYFDEIEKSIHDYDENIKIIFNTPLMLFDTDTTNTAKNTRLEFVKSLYSHYKDADNIYISPIYFNVDCYSDFKFEENTVDEYNQNSSMSVTDTTHPNNGGYLNIAKATLSFIKSID